MATGRQQASITDLQARVRLQLQRDYLNRLWSFVGLITQHILLLSIVIIGAVLRFYKLGAWSFWGDEMLTVINVADGFNQDLIRQSLSLVLIQITISTLGVSEWSARLVPTLIGIVSIAILFFPIRKVFGRKVALLSALLLAISPWHLYWSQNARFYTLLLLMYTLALLLLHIGLEEDRPWYVLLAVLFFALAIKERLLALFLVPVVFAYLLLLAILPLGKPQGLRRVSSSTLRLGALLVVAGYFSLPYIRNLPEWFAGFGSANNSPFWTGAGVAYYVRLPVIILGLTGAAYLLMKRQRAGLLLFLSAVIPPLSLMIIAPFHYTANRYAFVSLTSWIILAAVAAVELIRHLSQQKQRAAAMWIGIGVVFVLTLDSFAEDVLYFRYQNGNRDDWKAAFVFVTASKGTDDVVISRHKPLADYYMEERTVSLQSVEWPMDVETSPVPIWFVEDMVVEPNYPRQHAWLERNAQLHAVFDTNVQVRNFRMRVYRYDPAKN